MRDRWNVNVVGIAPPGGDPYRPWPEVVLDVNDDLIVRGARANILQMAAIHKLEPKGPVSLVELERLSPADLELAEVLIPPYSHLVGHTLEELDFSDSYHLNVMALLRDDQVSARELLETLLQAGDRLLVEGPPKQMLALRESDDMIVLSDLGVPAEDLITKKSSWMLWILAGVVLSSLSGLVALPIAALLGAFVSVLLGCSSAEGAHEDVDWSVIVLVAALLPLGVAISDSGLAGAIGGVLTEQFGALGPQAVLALMVLLAVVLTQVLANMIVALMLAPIAFDLAEAMGVNPEPFAIALLLAVATAFLTPITEVINLLVRKPGGYRFQDYLKLNLPVLIIVLVAAIWLTPLIWPF